MSKSNLGRCAAVGIAGLTAMTSMASIAMVATAEAYPSYVYEFTYGGIATTQVYHTAISAVSDNKYFTYATQADAQKVFNKTVGFKSTAAIDTDFWSVIDTAYAAYIANTSGAVVTKYPCTDRNTTDDSWQYAIAKAFSAAVDPVYVEESYEQRAGDSLGGTYAFKSLSERKSAMNEIAAKNKSNYSSKYSSANSALGSDLSKAISAYQTAQRDTISKVQAKATEAFKTSDTFAIAGCGVDVSALDGTLPTTLDKTEDRNNPTSTYTLTEWVNAQNAYVNAQVKALNEVAALAKKEFTEAYAVANWAFDYDAAKDGGDAVADAAPFVTADGPVKFGGSIGSYIKYSTATYTTMNGALDLTKDYYRTIGQYVDPTSYAFAGEIIIADDRNDGTLANIKGLLLDSDRWSLFSALMEGKPVDNGNTTEPGSGTTTDDTDTKTTTWYPDSASYRAASEVSYLGKNGYWYTSSSAASVYGGGYTGTSKNSGFSTVNSSANGKAIYFNSTTGTYSTSSSSYSYIVKEATSTDNSNDPYFSYIWGNKNTTTTVPAGSPAISGASKYAGWTNISAYITNRGKSGSTYSINMNDESIVPASVLAAAKAKNVTLTFVNDNGSKVTVKPGKVSTTSDLKVSVTYNVKDVKTSLVKKAKKVNPGTVSTAQVRIGNDGSIGGTATVNVKFSTKRSGCTVKAYRLTASGSLVKEASGTVSSTGRVNLNLTKGGSYLLVVID